MALTQSAWTSRTVNDKVVSTCTVTATTAENDAYTLPLQIDSRKPLTVSVTCSATPDGQALPVDLWVGYGTNFALSGDGASVAATSGYEYKNIIDDIVLAVSGKAYPVLLDPNLAQTEVVAVATGGLKSRLPACSYIAINLDGGSTLNAHTTTFVVVQ